MLKMYLMLILCKNMLGWILIEIEIEMVYKKREEIEIDRKNIDILQISFGAQVFCGEAILSLQLFH
mgnify:CR=1 FL=1